MCVVFFAVRLVASSFPVHEILGALFAVAIGIGVLPLIGFPWRRTSQTTLGAHAVVHGLVGIAALGLASELTGFTAGSAWAAGGLELVIAGLCVRALHRRSRA
ncbi:MAG: hypothetical protein Rubg2KO_40830 [Rubricoccaceae bacterium]